MSDVIDEFKKAKKEGRQPICIYCGKPLEVKETQYIDLEWNWDKKKKEYVKSERGDGDTDGPRCKACEAKDWDFTNNQFCNY